jgi:hypothetical protein
MKTEPQNKHKNITVVINHALNQYKSKVLFPKKLAKANEVIKKMGIPIFPDETLE